MNDRALMSYCRSLILICGGYLESLRATKSQTARALAETDGIKRVITYGTFDLFHFGHLELLRRAKELGDYLVVAVSTDEFNEKSKGKASISTYKERAAIVSAIEYVDEVIPETCWKQKESDVKDHKVDVFVMGDDWREFFVELDCEIVYLRRTPHVSSTEIKENITKRIAW